MIRGAMQERWADFSLFNSILCRHDWLALFLQGDRSQGCGRRMQEHVGADVLVGKSAAWHYSVAPAEPDWGRTQYSAANADRRNARCGANDNRDASGHSGHSPLAEAPCWLQRCFLRPSGTIGLHFPVSLTIPILIAMASFPEPKPGGKCRR